MLHAHLTFESSDCDGTYGSNRKEEMTTEEKADSLGDLEFKQRIASDIMWTEAKDGTLRVTEGEVEWQESTEEGYRYARAVWCDDANCEGSVF